MIKPIHLFWTGPILGVLGMFLLLGFWPYLELHASHLILGVLLWLALAIGVPITVVFGTHSTHSWTKDEYLSKNEENALTEPETPT